MIACVIIVLICVLISVIRLKTRAVKREYLLAAREVIIKRALETEERLNQ